MPADEGVQVKAVVKWFNTGKGFGFVAPADGTPDAFLHISVLNRMGMQQIADGTELLVMVAHGNKGPQVTRIIEVLGISENAGNGGGFGGGGGRGFGGGYAEERPYISSGGPEIEMSGTVKWFKPDKGFGFVSADDGDKDIFVHKSVLRRAGIMELEPGQRVKMRVQTASKGREAVWIAAE